MHERLFANQRQLGPDDLSRHAKAIGLDMRAFEGCLGSGKHAVTVKKGISEAQQLGATGTPTFFIGVTGPDSELKATRLVGAQPYAAFKVLIDRLLAAPK